MIVSLLAVIVVVLAVMVAAATADGLTYHSEDFLLDPLEVGPVVCTDLTNTQALTDGVDVTRRSRPLTNPALHPLSQALPCWLHRIHWKKERKRNQEVQATHQPRSPSYQPGPSLLAPPHTL